MSALTFLILTLAAYRLTRLVAVDVITQPLRDRVVGWSQTPRWFIELLGCTACTGFWVAGAVHGVWDLTDPSNDSSWLKLLTWFAIAGGQSLLSAVDGWLTDDP